jgi:hypothetical protein
MVSGVGRKSSGAPALTVPWKSGEVRVLGAASMSKFVDKHDLQLDVGEPTDSEFAAACEHIVRDLLEGVRHGFFKMTISVEREQSNKTSITIEAGKSFRFIV